MVTIVLIPPATIFKAVRPIIIGHTYLNKEEAADYCGVTTRTITRAASNGLISTYLVDTGVEKSSIGGRRMNRYSLADIKKLVKKEVK